MNDLVSIVVPIYNAEKYIEKLLDNLMKQGIENYEIILVNDGSKDNSLEICNNCKKNNYKNCIKVIDKENGGPSSARNAGLEIASGKYIIFSDVDDSYEKNSFSKMLKYMKKKMLVLSGIKINVSNQSRNIVYSDNEVDVLNRNDTAKIYLKKLLNSTCNKIYDLELIKEKNIWFDETYNKGEDLRFNLEYIKYIDDIICLNQPLYTYFLKEGGTNLIYRKNEVEILNHNYNNLINFLEKNCKTEKKYLNAIYKIYLVNLVDRLWRFFRNEKTKRNIDDINYSEIIDATNYSKIEKKIMKKLFDKNRILFLKIFTKILKK